MTSNFHRNLRVRDDCDIMMGSLGERNRMRAILDWNAYYIDLALAADAKLIVSRDKDLLSLRDPNTEEGRDFMARFPQLTILTPPEVLVLLQSA